MVALKSLQVLLGFFALVESKVGQAVEHQKLGPVANEVDGHRVYECGDLFECGPGLLRLGFLLGNQRA